MTRAVLAEVLDALDAALCHTPYAVCGLAAMAVWGFGGRAPSHVSVVCPSHSAAAIRSWAAAAGMVLYPDRPDTIGLTTASDGVVRRVRIKFLSDGFEALRAVRPSGVYDGAMGRSVPTCRARVLALPSLLDLMARGYVRAAEAEAGGNWVAACDRRAIAQDMFWVLFRLIDGGFVEEGAMPLAEADVPSVVDGRFWWAFTAAYPGAADTFAQAGLNPGLVRFLAMSLG